MFRFLLSRLVMVKHHEKEFEEKVHLHVKSTGVSHVHVCANHCCIPVPLHCTMDFGPDEIVKYM